MGRGLTPWLEFPPRALPSAIPERGKIDFMKKGSVVFRLGHSPSANSSSFHLQQSTLEMSDNNHRSSVTDWVLAESRGLDASRQLWERYIADVVRACEARLTRNQRRSLSGDDLAQEVFHDFFVGLRSHAFSRLRDRGDVQQILAMLVERTAIDCRRRHHSVKAGGGRVQAFSELGTNEHNGLAHSPTTRPIMLEIPSDEAELRRLLRTLVPDLTNPKLQNIVCDRIMGCTLEEIAERNQVSEHTVGRKLRLLIRRLQARTTRES